MIESILKTSKHYHQKKQFMIVRTRNHERVNVYCVMFREKKNGYFEDWKKFRYIKPRISLEEIKDALIAEMRNIYLANEWEFKRIELVNDNSGIIDKNFMRKLRAETYGKTF